jgi:hypothetical protein
VSWKPHITMPRDQVRNVACPACGAPAGEPCLGRKGPRASNHADRVAAARGIFAPDTSPSQRRSKVAASGLSAAQRQSVAISWKIHLAIVELGYAKAAGVARRDHRLVYQLDQRVRELAAIRDAVMQRANLSSIGLGQLAADVGLV